MNEKQPSLLYLLKIHPSSQVMNTFSVGNMERSLQKNNVQTDHLHLWKESHVGMFCRPLN